MSLIPWRSESEAIFPLRKQLNRLFDDFFGEGLGVLSANGAWGPAVDVVETPETVVVKVEVPGINPKEVEISVNHDVLNLRGEKREEKEEKGKSYHRVERRHGAFARSLQLPCLVDGGLAEAESKDGVLTITIPKQKAAMQKKVEVKVK